MVAFAISKRLSEGHARIGELVTQAGIINTPSLLPVVSFIGGSTPNCGGLWKYLRQELFKANLPIMSEIMHFLNFSLSPNSLLNWRGRTFHEWFTDFEQPLFLD